MACIYQIKNLVNGKLYIGSTIRRKQTRKCEHFCELRKGRHYNDHLQKSFNKYGESNFEFSILETFEFPKEYSKLVIADYLVCREIYLIQSLGSHYNIKTGIGIGATGYHHSEETKRKISEAGTAKIPSKNTLIVKDREKRRLEGKLYNTNPNTKNKELVTLSLKGRKHTPEAIAKITERSMQEDNIERIKIVQKEAAKRRIGLHHSVDAKIKMMNTKFGKVNQIGIYNRKTQELVDICNFSTEASKITGVSRSAISNNLVGISKYSGDYVFTYLNN